MYVCRIVAEWVEKQQGEANVPTFHDSIRAQVLGTFLMRRSRLRQVCHNVYFYIRVDTHTQRRKTLGLPKLSSSG